MHVIAQNLAQCLYYFFQFQVLFRPLLNFTTPFSICSVRKQNHSMDTDKEWKPEHKACPPPKGYVRAMTTCPM